MKRNQSGFTLIEIAIVLVIIGLLLGGILKGQELINSAKVKNLATDLKNIPVFIYGFQDKYKALPGDDSTVTTHLAGAAACTPAAAGPCAPGSGIIDGAWNATAITSESFVFWQHVRLADLAPGPTDTAAGDYRPKNAVGGYIGITNAANTPITGLKEGLAPMVVDLVASFLQALKERVLSILLIEQKLKIAMQISQRIYVMGHGHMVFQGSPDELRSNKLIRQEWLEV